MKKMLVPGLIIGAALAVVMGYGLNSHWLGSAVAAGLGLVWLSGQRRSTVWVTNLGFIALVGLAAWGVWVGAAAGWMLVATVAALAAWDLTHFRHRLAQVEQVIETEVKLEQDHLQRLLLVLGVGGLGGSAALLIRFELSFGWVIGLSLLLLIGLSRLLGPGRP